MHTYVIGEDGDGDGQCLTCGDKSSYPDLFYEPIDLSGLVEPPPRTEAPCPICKTLLFDDEPTCWRCGWRRP